VQSYLTYTSQTSGDNTIYLVATSAVYSASNATSLTDSSVPDHQLRLRVQQPGAQPDHHHAAGGNRPGRRQHRGQDHPGFNTFGWLTESIDAASEDTTFSYDPATGFQIGMDQQLGDDESPISTSASDDIYGRPVFEWTQTATPPASATPTACLTARSPPPAERGDHRRERQRLGGHGHHGGQQRRHDAGGDGRVAQLCRRRNQGTGLQQRQPAGNRLRVQRPGRRKPDNPAQRHHRRHDLRQPGREFQQLTGNSSGALDHRQRANLR